MIALDYEGALISASEANEHANCYGDMVIDDQEMHMESLGCQSAVEHTQSELQKAKRELDALKLSDQAAKELDCYAGWWFMAGELAGMDTFLLLFGIGRYSPPERDWWALPEIGESYL